MPASYNKKVNRKWLFPAILFLPVVSFCQTPAAATTRNDFTNPLFWFMLTTIVLLAFAISTLGTAVKNISGIAKHHEKEKESQVKKNAPAKAAGLFLIFLFGWEKSFGSVIDNTVYSGQSTIGGMAFGTFYFLLAIIIVELICLVVLNTVMKDLLAPYKTVKAKLKPLVKEKSLLEKLNASVDIAEEENILMDHSYDGIQELDNNLPPWWKYGFYFTIIVAVIYLFYYHLAGTGDLQNEELRKDLAEANAEISDYMKQSANNVDETTVKFLDSPSDLAAGKDLFLTHCGTCHGRLGEGGVGPNFADDYCLHGGGIVNIFKSIKYGWSEKGMKSWKDELSPIQIAQVASFVKTLMGTNPPNQKAKQGELYIDEKKPVADSLQPIFDSVKVNSIDTMKIANTK